MEVNINSDKKNLFVNVNVNSKLSENINVFPGDNKPKQKEIEKDVSSYKNTNENESSITLDISSIQTLVEELLVKDRKINFIFNGNEKSSIPYDYETALEACPVLLSYNEEQPWGSKVIFINLTI